jgi:hypothetical protein
VAVVKEVILMQLAQKHQQAQQAQPIQAGAVVDQEMDHCDLAAQEARGYSY